MKEKNMNHFWNNILNGEKILSDKEAKEMENVSERIRRESGFRV